MNSIVKMPRVKLLLLVTLSFAASVGASPAKGQPIVPAPDGTDTQINNSGDTYNITGGQLSGDRANLFHSFSQFNLSEGQIANFLSHPEIQNILGRINGGDPSVINGLIQVTGGNSNLYLMNPAGIIFGPNASLDVPAAFNASTATGIGFDDNWFYAFGENDWASLVGTPNTFRFDPIAPGSILNEGNLTVATGESITLLGGTVINTGTIKAPSGTITLHAVPGQSLLRISQAGQLLSLDITPETDVPITPLSLPELLTGTDIKHASSVSVNEQGQVLLTGSGITVSPSGGVAIASGTLDGSSSSETEPAAGGTVRVMGGSVGVVDANINVSGDDGGNVLIGGDGTSQVYIGNDGAIAADGMRSKGGYVRVAAEEMTGFYGTITARGDSSAATNGGRVEVIGRGGLDVTNASVDASALRGNQGTWLLESGNIIIGNNLLEGEIADIFDRTEAMVNADDISSALDNGTNVTIASRPVGSTQHFGQITVISAIKKTDGVQNTLSLNAANEIFVNGQIISDAGKLNVLVSAGGDITFDSASIFSNGGYIRLTSNSSNIFAGEIRSGSLEGGNGGDITLEASSGAIATGNIDSSAFIQSRGGNVELRASDNITTGNINAAGPISSGDITLKGPVILERDILIESGNGGSITFEGTVDGNQQLTLNSGTGTVQFNDTVGKDIRLSGLDIVSENIGIADGVYTGGDQRFEGLITLTESATFDAGSGTIAFHEDLRADAANLTITADEIEIMGFLRGSGSLLLQPGTRSRNIALGSDRETESLSLTNSELNAIEDWLNITIGRSNSRGRITVTGDVSFKTPEVKLRSPVWRGAIDSSNGTITNRGSIELQASANIASGNITAGNSIGIVSERGNVDTRGGTISGGAIAITAAEDVNVGNISASARNGGNGGNIYIEAGGSINGEPGTKIDAVSVEGEGGNITLGSGRDIHTSNLNSSGQNGGGDITLNSSGNIDTSSGNLRSGAHIGEGGSISVTATGDVTTGAIDSSSAGSARGGNITINATNGKIDTLTGEIISSSARGDGGSITMVAAGDIITGASVVASGGTNGGAIALQSDGGSIDAGTIESASVAGSGGDITSQAGMGTIKTGNLNASGQAQGGQLSIGADRAIATGQINTNAEVGNGGSTTLTTNGDISVEFINAEGGPEGLGGDVSIAGELFRATDGFETSATSTNEASISTAGGLGGGAIAIRHAGGSQLEAFNIGDGSVNGTAAAITTGEDTIEPSQSFAGGSNLGNITIETKSPGIPLSEENPPPEDPPAPPEEDLTPGEEMIDPPEDLSEEPPVDLSPEEDSGPISIEPPVSEDEVTSPAEPSPEPDAVNDPEEIGEPPEDLSEPDENLPPQDEIVLDDAPISEEATETENQDIQTEADAETELEEPPRAPVESISFQNSPASDRALLQDFSEREAEFTNQFAEYLQIPSDKYKVRTLDDARHLLGKIEQSSKVKPAIIYISFVPSQQKDGIDKGEEKSSLIWENQLLGKSAPNLESDYLELVLVTAEGLPVRYRIEDATRSRVMSTAKEFYREVTNRRKIDTTSYLPSAQQLYRWMIQPLGADLQGRGIQNLVFIMDGGLRSLPLAALHDGEEFLVQQYSFGLMPSLTLSDTSYVDIKKKNLLAMGASEFLEHSPLPAVPIEIEKIVQEWGGESFLNQAFTFANLKGQLQKGSYGIIHLATHAEFRPGTPRNSYIQLWSDRKLHLDQMEQLGWDKLQVDLVVLSACQTALGNEEAEFGFAGFAVKAGVKSVLASLWYVSDEGTLGLMTEFYGQLKNAPIKAEALRQAQMAMIAGRIRLEGDRLYLPAVAEGISLPPTLRGIQQTSLSHPYFWSAFTMIGNPW
ncbi:MAG: CHAT domain-containing protein [Hormoscilla sp.]